VESLATGLARDRSDARAPVEESGAAVTSAPPASIRVRWLGRVAYDDAWDLQHRVAAARAHGRIGDQLLLLEHDPVLTLGRHADASHVRATAAVLAARGIDVVRVERGGEVTYHGPGQLVAYPIVRLADRGLLLRPYVRALEAAMIATCAGAGVAARRRDGHPGCWCDAAGSAPRKIGALGVRVERGVTYHGIALNVDTDLRDFDLIDPCGMPDVVSTSIAEEVGRTAEAPSTAAVARAGAAFAEAFAVAIGADLVGTSPADADPAVERGLLEADLASANRPAEADLASATPGAADLVAASRPTAAVGAGA
jgi:lipoyl(octanoyl) transferase